MLENVPPKLVSSGWLMNWTHCWSLLTTTFSPCFLVYSVCLHPCVVSYLFFDCQWDWIESLFFIWSWNNLGWKELWWNHLVHLATQSRTNVVVGSDCSGSFALWQSMWPLSRLRNTTAEAPCDQLSSMSLSWKTERGIKSSAWCLETCSLGLACTRKILLWARQVFSILSAAGGWKIFFIPDPNES